MKLNEFLNILKDCSNNGDWIIYKGSIRTKIFYKIGEASYRFCPISYVAKEFLKFNNYDAINYGRARKILGLSDEITDLILDAADIKDVCDENNTRSLLLKACYL